MFSTVEGICLVDDERSNGIIFIFGVVGYCDWEGKFDRYLKEFVLTMCKTGRNVWLLSCSVNVTFFAVCFSRVLDPVGAFLRYLFFPYGDLVFNLVNNLNHCFEGFFPVFRGYQHVHNVFPDVYDTRSMLHDDI